MKTNKAPVTVAVVEDDKEFREFLQALISGPTGFVCVGAYGSAEEALDHLPSQKPQILVVDLELPGLSGLDLIQQVNRAKHRPDILVLTVSDDPQKLFQALAAGAVGYLLKPPTSPARILEALEEVHEGGSPMTPSIARLVTRTFLRRQGEQKALEQLTPREREIIELVAQGYVNKEIAARLSISERTVGTHLRNIYDKLHVHSRTAALFKYRGNGQ